MARWRFEPGHTAAEFCVRHMMVTDVRGHLKNIEGFLEFDPEKPEEAYTEVRIYAQNLCTHEEERDTHLRSDHFLDVKNHPLIEFRSTNVVPIGKYQYKVIGSLTIRGVTRMVTLGVRFNGKVHSPFDDFRIGFYAETVINRHDFGVSWDAETLDGGKVVGDDVHITIDAEAILEK